MRTTLAAKLLAMSIVAPSTTLAQVTLPTEISRCVREAFRNNGMGYSIGNIGVGVSTWGSIADGNYTCYDGPSGGFMAEYPVYSNVRYLQGALLVGGVQGFDTLVSVGGSGLLFSGTELRTTCKIAHTASPNLRTYECLQDVLSDSSKSDYDVSIELADTLKDPRYVVISPNDGRPHKPLGLIIKQNTYGWASGSGAQFVIHEYLVTNLGVPGDLKYEADDRRLKDIYIGVNGSTRASTDQLDNSWGWNDNLVEFVPTAPSPLLANRVEQFDLVLPYDNDGDPGQIGSAGYGKFSAPDVVGLALLARPSGGSRVSFNWWVSAIEPDEDWGPVRRTSKLDFVNGGLGDPIGDRSIYMLMSNGEVDYPQIETALDHTADGWLEPPEALEDAKAIAEGVFPQFMVSFGPFDLPRDSTVRFAMAVVGGKDLHQDPNNHRDFWDPERPEFYRSRLDLSDLLRNTQWAKWTWDNPGVDTDGDGFAGEWYLRGSDTVYYRGDGVPDIRAALPPPTPSLSFDARSHRVAIHWNGYRTETEKDVFTQRVDFEGYRVYMSRTARETEWAFLAQRDLINYSQHTWNDQRGRWESIDPPFTLDSLKGRYDALCDSTHGFPFHPDSFSVPDVDRALLEIRIDPDHPETIDSVYRYFTPYEANNLPSDVSLADAVQAGMDVTGVVRRLFPRASPTDLAYRVDGTPYLPYYEYEYVVKDLQLAEPLFLAVTAFDHGDPASHLDPMESALRNNAREVWAINEADVVKSERPEPGVYPNPYRLIDDYNGNNWENRRGLEPDRERARQVTFYNVPDTCTLSIWSLDGDLVRKIKHYADPGASEATVVRWDLITRNTQAVKTGIYIWSIESRFGTDVGKLVIIK